MVKSPQIKELMNQGYPRSVVSRLIIEELLKEVNLEGMSIEELQAYIANLKKQHQNKRNQSLIGQAWLEIRRKEQEAETVKINWSHDDKTKKKVADDFVSDPQADTLKRFDGNAEDFSAKDKEASLQVKQDLKQHVGGNGQKDPKAEDALLSFDALLDAAATPSSSGGVKDLVIDVLSEKIGDIAANALEDQVFNKIDKFLLAAQTVEIATGAATAGGGWVAAIATAAARAAIGKLGKTAAKKGIKLVVTKLVLNIFDKVSALDEADALITTALGSHQAAVLAKIKDGDVDAAKAIIQTNALDIFKNLITMAARGDFGAEAQGIVKDTLGYEIEILGINIPIGPFLTEFIIGNIDAREAIQSDDTAQVNAILQNAPGSEVDVDAEETLAGDEDTNTSGEDDTSPNRFVPTKEVEEQIVAMKGFYDKPYLYEQGTILRDMIRALQGAMKGEETTAGITANTNDLQEENKELNVKNIKASLNAFLQQTRQVKKALKEYIAMAKQGKMGATRKKAILDKEVDRLIEYGKSIIASLPKNLRETEENAASDESTNLQPLHDFINFVLGEDSFKSINKSEVQTEIDSVKTILKVFPNVAPFGQAENLDIDLKDYDTKFEAAINDNLRTAIANFKALEKGTGGETAISGLRDALITFLGEGLAILGKGSDGEDFESPETEEAVDPDESTAEISPTAPEAIIDDFENSIWEDEEDSWEEEEGPPGTAERHPDVNNNSVAAYLFKQTENDTNPLFISADKIYGEFHTNRVLDYLADNKIKMKYTKDTPLNAKDSSGKATNPVKAGDRITIKKESKWERIDGEHYMAVALTDGRIPWSIPIEWFLHAGNFTVEEEEEEEIDNPYPDFDETFEEQIQTKLETIIEHYINNRKR